MEEFPKYLQFELMDNFHWTDMEDISIEELITLHKLVSDLEFDIPLVVLIEFWILYSQSMDATFLMIRDSEKKFFTNFIKNWIKEATE